ncbi:hypothetical protein GCM10027273_10900 [Nocardioides pakistanensis]
MNVRADAAHLSGMTDQKRPSCQGSRAAAIYADLEAEAEQFLAAFSAEEQADAVMGLYFDDGGRIRTRYRSMSDHPFSPALVAHVTARLRHPALSLFRHRTYDVCALVEQYPAETWDDVLVSLFFDADQQVRTHHHMLRLV